MTMNFSLRTLLLAGAASCLLMACTNVPTSQTTATGTAAATATTDNARTALDWAGTYRGILPCADCEGIETTVVLTANGQYRSQMRYLGASAAPFNEHGRFIWNAAGNTVTLEGTQPAHYFVEENRIVRLAMDGSRIQGSLAAHYVLKKLSEPR